MTVYFSYGNPSIRDGHRAKSRLLPSLAGLPVISLTDETEQVIGGSVDIWLMRRSRARLKQSGRTLHAWL